MGEGHRGGNAHLAKLKDRVGVHCSTPSSGVGHQHERKTRSAVASFIVGGLCFLAGKDAQGTPPEEERLHGGMVSVYRSRQGW